MSHQVTQKLLSYLTMNNDYDAFKGAVRAIRWKVGLNIPRNDKTRDKTARD